MSILKHDGDSECNGSVNGNENDCVTCAIVQYGAQEWEEFLFPHMGSMGFDSG